MICFGSDLDCPCTEIVIAASSFSRNVHFLVSIRECKGGPPCKTLLFLFLRKYEFVLLEQQKVTSLA